MSARLCIVVLEHNYDEYFTDLITGIMMFCPDADIVWYDSGVTQSRVPARDPRIVRLPCSRPLGYAKVTPFFLDIFEWAAGKNYEYLVNVESDMAFINPGFQDFLVSEMADCDYLAPGFKRHTPRTSKWRPYYSLRGELAELHRIIGLDYTNGGFSPGQVFKASYFGALLASPYYHDLHAFVERNQAPGKSFTLQEVLFPTLADALRLNARDYPASMTALNRYRPYHAKRPVELARDRGDAHFVHPVRRDPADPCRRYVRSLYGRDNVGVHRD